MKTVDSHSDIAGKIITKDSPKPIERQQAPTIINEIKQDTRVIELLTEAINNRPTSFKCTVKRDSKGSIDIIHIEGF